MITVINRLPDGWSITDEGGRWNIYDTEDSLVCSAKDADQLHRVLSIEFALAQQYAASVLIVGGIKPAEA
jgi:hypothetical protein